MMKAIRIWLILMVPVVLSACGGAQMTPATEPPKIRAGESMVVFMRASMLGGAVAASVFDVTTDETKFVGLVNYGTKYAHPVKPGNYTFMVIGESADFMQVAVLPDRTYYALVTPRIGMWKARFSFKPIRHGQLGRDHELGGAERGRHQLQAQGVLDGVEQQAREPARLANLEGGGRRYRRPALNDRAARG
jgi:hypothetical protein